MAKGRVYWLTGLSNSGKTTIGTALYYSLKKRADNIVILDGDMMKDITTILSEEEYSYEGRLARARRYSSLCKLLSDQGITVIICTISMFDEIRAWNRNHIKGYVEILIDAPEEVLVSRDKKGVYRKEAWIEYPENPDLKLINDGSVSIKELAKRIEDYKPLVEDDYDRDKEYWNWFYTDSGKPLQKPSAFAIEASKYLCKGKHLLELGCGNGRDSLYFLEQGVRVTAIDASDYAIDSLNRMTLNNGDALFVCDDFVKCQSLYQIKYDYIYSRFTLHAINESQENELLKNIRMGLDENGLLFIEARTTKDDLCGKGVEVERNAFVYNDHYRRFIDVSEFAKKLEQLGFVFEYLEETNGFSKTEDSDPVLMRCIAKLKAHPQEH